jgi:hypothetical protein
MFMDTHNMLHRPRFTSTGEEYQYPEGHDYGWAQPDRSFDEEWQLGAAMQAPSIVADVEGPQWPRHETERVVRTLTTLRRLGLREWTETVEVEVYRSTIRTLDEFAVWLSTSGRRS